MDDLLISAESFSLEVNPHLSNCESVTSYLLRLGLQDDMPARTFMEMKHRDYIAKITVAYPMKKSFYGATVEEAIKQLNNYKNASLKEKQ